MLWRLDEIEYKSSYVEVKDIIKFYETPSGKKLLLATPAMVAESTQLGQEWGREIAERVMKKLQQKGLDKK